MYLYLVRHGESEGNAKQLFFGWHNYPLTERGREQAWQVADKLRVVEFERCCASDLERAWETAEICTTGRLVTPEKFPGLREQFMGNLENKTWEEAEAMYGEALHIYLNDWCNKNLPSVEPLAAMRSRVTACLHDILAQGKDTLVVAHNGSLLLLLQYLGLIGTEEMNNMYFQLRFGCYSVVRIENGKAILEGINL